jgi:hypothetical protein
MALLSGTGHTSSDLQVLDNGIVFADGKDELEYLWFHLVEREAGRDYDLFRVVPLKMLRYLPQEARQEAGYLDTMRSALTGMYNQRIADYDPCMLVAGVFDPPLGVVQCYGAVGIGDTLDEAARNGRLGMAAVDGVMANFAQSRLESLNIQKAEWLRRAFLEMAHSLVVIGQPDPRLSARGMGREGPGERSAGMTLAGEAAYTLQQNEMLFRALARLEEEFLFLVLASRVKQRDLAQMLEGVAAEASVPASRQTGAKAVTFGLSFPLMASGGLGQSAAGAYGKSEGQSASDGVSESDVKSHIEGHATTVGHAVTDGTAHTVGHATTSGGSTSHSVSVVESTSHVDGQSQASGDTVGSADTAGSADTIGSAHTQGHATSVGNFSSSSIAVGHSETTPGPTLNVTQPGGTHTETMPGGTHTETTPGGSQSTTDYGAAPADLGDAMTPPRPLDGGGGTPGINSSNQIEGARDHIAQAAADGHYGVITAPASQSTLGANAGVVASGSEPTTPAVSMPFGQVNQTTHPTGPTVSESNPSGPTVADSVPSAPTVSVSVPLAPTVSTSIVVGGASGSSSSSTDSVADTASQAHTESQAHTDSQAHSESQGASQADGVSRSVATSDGYSSFASTTNSVADTTSHAETDSWARSDSVADGQSHGVSVSHAAGRTSAMSIGRAVSVGRTLGMGAGVVPSIAASKSYQWWDDRAVQLTQILRAQEELLRRATLEGAFLTDAYLLCRTERGAAAAEAAVRQAFHGSELPVVTPVQTRRLTPAEQAYIRLHALCFTQSTREERVAGALEAYKDSSLLLPLQLAAYMAPGLFEEGAAVTTQERIPAFAFVPDMPGDVVLAHLCSTETGRLTAAQLRLSEDRMFHFAFASDTGYGKTVAAERLALETTKYWHYRTIVLDFGAGWRRMLNAPLGQPGRAEVWQVFPGAVVPFRWNPLQIGRRVNPERQMQAMCELTRNAGRMGPRQLGYMRRALKELYLESGVLTSFREVFADDRWGVVQEDEWGVLDAARDEWSLPRRPRERLLHLADLEAVERQALAVQRSKQVSLTPWYQRLKKMYDDTPRNAVNDRTSLEGVLLRLEQFAEGEMEEMYGQGDASRSEGAVAVEDLGLLGPASDPWGISVLEGGAEMDEFAKAMIFSLIAWHLYNDAVVRRRMNIGRGPQQKLQIFFEEANKVLSGVATDVGDQTGSSSANQTSELWLAMWRDGRKYDAWLHVIAQTVSELPPGILSSCNNAFFSQTKNPRDRDLEMAHLAFSEKGFTDEDYKRFLSRMPAAQAICKLGYSQDVIHTTPFLCRPVMVPGLEPTDGELLAYHLAMQAARRRNGAGMRG